MESMVVLAVVELASWGSDMFTQTNAAMRTQNRCLTILVEPSSLSLHARLMIVMLKGFFKETIKRLIFSYTR